MMIQQAAPRKKRASILDMMLDPLGLDAPDDEDSHMSAQRFASTPSGGITAMSDKMMSARASLTAARQSLAEAAGAIFEILKR